MKDGGTDRGGRGSSGSYQLLFGKRRGERGLTRKGSYFPAVDCIKRSRKLTNAEGEKERVLSGRVRDQLLI